MNMIGHQNVCMHGAMLTQSNFAKFTEIANTIDAGEETGLPIVTELDSVLGNAGA